MNPIVLAALTGFVAGPAGALMAVVLGTTVLRRVRDRSRGAALAFAGGFILAVAFMELIRRGVETPGGWSVPVTLAGFAAGAAVRGLITGWISRGDPAAENSFNVDGEETEGADGPGAGQAHQIAISLAAVNLLEGLPVGIGFAVEQQLGLLIGGVMVFENFTEALSITTEMSREEKPGWRRLALVGAAPTATLGIGAVAGVLLGGVHPLVLAGLLGAGAGIMLYAVADDIVLDAHRLGQGAVTTFPLLLGIIVGVALVAVTGGSQG